MHCFSLPKALRYCIISENAFKMPDPEHIVLFCEKKDFYLKSMAFFGKWGNILSLNLAGLCALVNTNGVSVNTLTHWMFFTIPTVFENDDRKEESSSKFF